VLNRKAEHISIDRKAPEEAGDSGDWKGPMSLEGKRMTNKKKKNQE